MDDDDDDDTLLKYMTRISYFLCNTQILSEKPPKSFMASTKRLRLRASWAILLLLPRLREAVDEKTIVSTAILTI
jgi:hypothetical protein